MSNKNAAPFPLALAGDVIFLKCIVESISAYQPNTSDDFAIEIQNNIKVVPIGDDAKKFRAIMTTRINIDKSADAPYLIDMACMADFEQDGSLSAEEAHKGVTITGHNVLYGAIRESVAWITGRQAYGTFSLGLSVLTMSQEEKPSD